MSLKSFSYQSFCISAALISDEKSKIKQKCQKSETETKYGRSLVGFHFIFVLISNAGPGIVDG